MPNAALRVVGAHFAALGPFSDVKLAFPDDAVFDTGPRVILPGFVDALVLPHAVFTVGLGGWSGRAASAAELAAELDPDAWAAATRATLIAGLKRGVTTAFVVAPAHAAGIEGMAAVVAAAQETKVRVCIAGAVTDRHGEARAGPTTVCGVNNPARRSRPAGVVP